MAYLDLKRDGFKEEEYNVSASFPAKSTKSFLGRLMPKDSRDVSKTGREPDVKPCDPKISDAMFGILKDFLQPDSKKTMQETLDSIAAYLPGDPKNVENTGLADVCFDIVEQIPYHHPALLKLVRLLEGLGKLPRLNNLVEKVSLMDKKYLLVAIKPNLQYKSTLPHWEKFVLFNDVTIDKYDQVPLENSEDMNEYVNISAFIAILYEHRIYSMTPNKVIYTFRRAFEKKQGPGPLRDVYVLASAQYILWSGQRLFTHILCPGEDENIWQAGELYDGEPFLDLKRWNFWKDGFRAIAGENGVGEECRGVSKKVVELMGAIESGMTF